MTRINEAKILVRHISCDCKCKFSSTTYNSNPEWNNDECQCECKKYCTCKKDYGWNPIIGICGNGKKDCWYFSNCVWWNYKIKFQNKKVRYKMDCYILHTVLLVIILLFIFAIICYHHAKHRSKLKKRIAVLET